MCLLNYKGMALQWKRPSRLSTTSFGARLYVNNNNNNNNNNNDLLTVFLHSSLASVILTRELTT